MGRRLWALTAGVILAGSACSKAETGTQPDAAPASTPDAITVDRATAISTLEGVKGELTLFLEEGVRSSDWVSSNPDGDCQAEVAKTPDLINSFMANFAPINGYSIPGESQDKRYGVVVNYMQEAVLPSSVHLSTLTHAEAYSVYSEQTSSYEQHSGYWYIDEEDTGGKDNHGAYTIDDSSDRWSSGFSINYTDSGSHSDAMSTSLNVGGNFQNGSFMNLTQGWTTYTNGTESLAIFGNENGLAGMFPNGYPYPTDCQGLLDEVKSFALEMAGAGIAFIDTALASPDRVALVG